MIGLLRGAGSAARGMTASSGTISSCSSGARSWMRSSSHAEAIDGEHREHEAEKQRSAEEDRSWPRDGVGRPVGRIQHRDLDVAIVHHGARGDRHPELRLVELPLAFAGVVHLALEPAKRDLDVDGAAAPARRGMAAGARGGRGLAPRRLVAATVLVACPRPRAAGRDLRLQHDELSPERLPLVARAGKAFARSPEAPRSQRAERPGPPARPARPRRPEDGRARRARRDACRCTSSACRRGHAAQRSRPASRARLRAPSVAAVP